MSGSASDPLEHVMNNLKPMDSAEALIRIRGLVASEPDYMATDHTRQISAETLRWIGQLVALTEAMKLHREEIDLRSAQGLLIRTRGESGVGEIRSVLYKVLASAELKAPAAAQGSFVAAGQKVDAYGAIIKIIETAKNSLLIIDPYMDATLIVDFLPAVSEGVLIQILADESSVKETLVPAARRWIEQYDKLRPLEVRFSPKKSLHDRLVVVDGKNVWSLTQSIKDFAKRSHAAALKVDDETGKLKIAAYEGAWEAAQVVS